MPKKTTGRPLPFSGRKAPIPPIEPLSGVFEFAEAHSSWQTQKTYKSCLRVFADWLQTHSGVYSQANSWPLNPKLLTVEMVLAFRKSLGAIYKQATIRNRVVPRCCGRPPIT